MTSWIVAGQAPLSMGFPRQEYWSRLPFPSLDLPDPGIEPSSLAPLHWQVDSLPLAPPGSLLRNGDEHLHPPKGEALGALLQSSQWETCQW